MRGVGVSVDDLHPDAVVGPSIGPGTEEERVYRLLWDRCRKAEEERDEAEELAEAAGELLAVVNAGDLDEIPDREDALIAALAAFNKGEGK
jgi:hypothetical protein